MKKDRIGERARPESVGQQSPGQMLDDASWTGTPRPEKGPNNPESDEWGMRHAEEKFQRGEGVQEAMGEL